MILLRKITNLYWDDGPRQDKNGQVPANQPRKDLFPLYSLSPYLPLFQRSTLCALVMAIAFLIANNCTRWWVFFEGLSQNGRHTKFSKNHRSLFEELTNGITFRHIHLDGQSL
jgi:hypothetical protein